jgi:xanthine/uracil permease
MGGIHSVELDWIGLDFTSFEKGLTICTLGSVRIGTSMIACFLEIFLSFMPIQYIKRVFPPLVTSITVMLIGVGLTGTGMK